MKSEDDIREKIDSLAREIDTLLDQEGEKAPETYLMIKSRHAMQVALEWVME